MRSSAAVNICGVKSQPWLLEAPIGQQINISLFDFETNTRTPGKTLQRNCQKYGYIIDKSSKKNISICEHVTGRIQTLYTSQANVVEIVLDDWKHGGDEGESMFLVRVIGKDKDIHSVRDVSLSLCYIASTD